MFSYLLVEYTVMLTLCTLGSLTVEQVYRDRDEFAKLVRNVASPDLGRMGIEILSFTIRYNSILTSMYIVSSLEK